MCQSTIPGRLVHPCGNHALQRPRSASFLRPVRELGVRELGASQPASWGARRGASQPRVSEHEFWPIPIRSGNFETLRQYPSYTKKNALSYARNERSANPDCNEALSSALTKLCSAQLAREELLTGTWQWRTSRSEATSPPKDCFLGQRLRCSSHAFKDLAEAFNDVTP